MTQESKIAQLEKDMVGVKHALSTQNDHLKRIEEVLFKVSETLEQMTVIREKVFSVQEEVEKLKNVFEDRKEVTDENNKKFADHVSQFKGGLAVFIFMFAIIQGMVVYHINTESAKAATISEKVQAVKEDHSITKEKVQRLEQTIKQNNQ